MRKTLVSMLSGALLFASACASNDEPAPAQPSTVMFSAPAIPVPPIKEPAKPTLPERSPIPAYQSNGYSLPGVIGGHSSRKTEDENFKIPIIALGKKPTPYVVGYNASAKKRELPFTFTRESTFVRDIDRNGHVARLENTIYGVFALDEIDTKDTVSYPTGKKPVTELWTPSYDPVGKLDVENGIGTIETTVKGRREFNIVYGTDAKRNSMDVYIFSMGKDILGSTVEGTRTIHAPAELKGTENVRRRGYRNNEGFYILTEISNADYTARNAPAPKTSAPVIIEVTEKK